MAASTRSRKAPAVARVEHQLEVLFEEGNEPNADILMRAMRVSGYTLEGTLSDLADNSVDAGAKHIVVHLERDSDSDEWTLYVADDGSAMGRDALDEMMRLGSRVDHDLDTDLGAFGVGSDTATLAIARRKHVITRGSDGPLSAVWDLDVIEEQRRFVKHLAEAKPEEVELFEAAFTGYGLKVPKTGTLVAIGKGDRVNRSQVPPAQRSVMRSFATTYRRFLEPNGELRVVVNGEPVEPSDPLMRSHAETEMLFDDEVEFSFRDAAGKKRTDKIGVAIAHVPDFGGSEANRKAGISIESSGFYILRNNREIVPHTTLGLYKRHNELARFRAELSFPGSMDEQLGVTFLKSAVALHPSQALRDKIKEVAFPYRRQSQSRYKKSKKDADIQVPHDEAAKHIKSKSQLLRTPEAETTNGGDPGQPGSEVEKGGKKDGKPSESTPNLRQRLATEVTFEAKDLGEYDPFYEPSLDGKKIVVTYNGKHPAYERLILENRENRGQLTAIDYLVWSLSAAELRAVDDEQAAFAQRMREDMSFNLRQLLKV